MSTAVKAWLLFLLAAVPAGARCDTEIYRWVDSEGKTHYSTEPREEGQPAADLPDIRKESLSNRIEFLRDNIPPDCSEHGGIDCSAGPDPQDNSVYCLDGFAGSREDYAERCSQAKLEYRFLVEFADEPMLRPHEEVYKRLEQLDPRQPIAFIAELRNLSDIEASGIEVFFKIPFHMPPKLPAEGAKKIPPYGAESFRLSYDELPPRATPRHFAEAQLKINCENCLSVKAGR